MSMIRSGINLNLRSFDAMENVNSERKHLKRQSDYGFLKENERSIELHLTYDLSVQLSVCLKIFSIAQIRHPDGCFSCLGS